MGTSLHSHTVVETQTCPTAGGVVVVVRGQQQGAREKPRLPLHPEEIAADPGTVLSSRSWPGEQKTAGFIFEGRWRDALVL